MVSGVDLAISLGPEGAYAPPQFFDEIPLIPLILEKKKKLSLIIN